MTPLTRRRIGSTTFLAIVVLIACGATWDAVSPIAASFALGVDSTHATTQRRRLDKVATELARYCGTNKAAGYLCAERARLDSARNAEVYVAPPPTDTGATPPPPPPPPPAPTGVVVLPGQSIQAAVDANPAGATFILKAGTHVRQNVVPKDGNVFRGEPGTVLDGQNATSFAFRGWNGSRWINSVTLRNFSITRYTPPAQNGAVWGGNDAANSGSGWVLDSMDVSYNKNLGVRVGNRMQVFRSIVSNNGTINIGGVGNGVLIDGSSFNDGNAGCVNDPGFESGGSKFAATDSLVVRNSTFHRSCGPGLWLDINNINYVLEGNRADSNTREGIVVEISYKGVIRNNSARFNGRGDSYRAAGWCWNAGIGVHASPDVEVYGNTVEANHNGIVGVQQARGAAYGDPAEKYGPYVIKNLYVHDNLIKQTTVVPSGWEDAAAGICQDRAIDVFSAAANNRFRNNTYIIGPTRPRPYAWANGWRTPAEWAAYGQQ